MYLQVLTIEQQSHQGFNKK